MEYLVIAFLIAVILILMQFKSRLTKTSRKEKKPAAVETGKPSKFCPLCNSPLSRGENVRSKVYPAGEKDSLMEVYGCPYCLPPAGKENRICPVCSKVLPKDGYVIGRYFVKPGKRHLHILGCTLCRKIK